MPGVIGCIDGTHVRIVRPVNFKKAYVNRKNYHSINVQVKEISLYCINCQIFFHLKQGICDADCRYLSINATKPGLSGLYDIQSLRDWKKFANGLFGHGFLLGDSGFGCSTYLITPSSEDGAEDELEPSPSISIRSVDEFTDE